MTKLSYEFARCPGVGSDDEGWREGCEHCLRRTEPGRDEWQPMMAPPEIIVFECEWLIEDR